MEATIPQTQDFKMHPELLRSVIKKQAGSLSKALLEGVMNSIDAGSTYVRVHLSAFEAAIVDDGKGFKDEQEISDFFATFGTPHVEGDATYGRFRMGRGQMFAYGVNTWRTGKFMMTVDIDKHLGFELETDMPYNTGCGIHIKLYEPMSEAHIYHIKRQITEMVKYAPIDIFFNDEKINLELKTEQCTVIDEAYIKANPSVNGGQLAVYNLGVLVCTIPAWKYGVSGTVVSRKQLDVNFARNEVLESCKVWKQIKKVLNEIGQKQVKRAKVLTVEEQNNVINRLVEGTMRTSETYNIKFLRDITGKAWSAKTIALAKFESYSVAEPNNIYADKLMQSKKALVLDVNCVALFECKPEELFVKFKYNDMPAYATMESLTTGFKSIGDNVEKKQWKASETAWCYVIELMQYYSRRYAGGKFGHQRRITVGLSDIAEAWTDGKTYIAFNRQTLHDNKMFVRGMLNVKAITNIATVLIHEMCHDTDSRENIHSPDFYREFHDLTILYLGEIVKQIHKAITPAKYKAIAVKAGESVEDIMGYLQNMDVE